MSDFLQHFFASDLFEFPIVRNLRIAYFSKNYCLEKPAYISSHVRITNNHNNQNLAASEGIGISSGVVIACGSKIKLGKHVWISEQATIEKEVGSSELIVGDFAWIGARSRVTTAVSYIGKNAVIGAGSLVTANVEDNCVVAGNPARVIRTLREDEMVREKQIND